MTRAAVLLPLVLGLTDGLLNALTLGSAAILGGHGLDPLLALRVGLAALVTAAFTMFVADYAERRAHLVRSARELSLTQPGRLAASALGRQALRESGAAMGVAAISSFAGASLPLLLGALLPSLPLVVIGVTVVLLGLLGAGLAQLVAGHRALWSGGMLLGGAAVTVLGAVLHIA